MPRPERCLKNDMQRKGTASWSIIKWNFYIV
jgi:hypothetical protein